MFYSSNGIQFYHKFFRFIAPSVAPAETDHLFEPNERVVLINAVNESNMDPVGERPNESEILQSDESFHLTASNLSTVDSNEQTNFQLDNISNHEQQSDESENGQQNYENAKLFEVYETSECKSLIL